MVPKKLRFFSLRSGAQNESLQILRLFVVARLFSSSTCLLLSGWCFPSAPNSCSTLAALTLIDFQLHHFSPQSLLVFVSSAALLQIPFFFSLRSRLSQARVSKAVSLKARCKTSGKDPQLYPPCHHYHGQRHRRRGAGRMKKTIVPIAIFIRGEQNTAATVSVYSLLFFF